MKVLLTGVAGFIGSAVSKKLTDRGDTVIGIDNFNDYYDPNLKENRINEFCSNDLFKLYRMDISNFVELSAIFEKEKPDFVINLAAQAGVRYSIENPHVYVQSNVVGCLNILECSKIYNIKHLVYASSSSVYGNNNNFPFKIDDNVDHPISIYAATKKTNELMAHTYSHLFQLPCTGLRFFTAYGPWGRPDMAPFLFTSSIINNEPIKVFNNGDLLRDFTYIDDIVEGVVRSLDIIPSCTPPYVLHNIGNSQPVKLLDFIKAIEKHLGKEANKNFQPMQKGDVYATYADTSSLEKTTGFSPKTTLDTGIEKFIKWYLEYYNV